MAAVRHLVIDGPNVIQAWPELRALARRDREAARARLVKVGLKLHDDEGGRVTLVFDGRGAEVQLEYPARVETFLVIRTPDGRTGDDVIERLVARGPVAAEACRAVSADRALRSTVEAAGGETISPEELAAWVERLAERAGRRLTRHQRETEATWRS